LKDEEEPLTPPQLAMGATARLARRLLVETSPSGTVLRVFEPAAMHFRAKDRVESSGRNKTLSGAALHASVTLEPLLKTVVVDGRGALTTRRTGLMTMEGDEYVAPA